MEQKRRNLQLMFILVLLIITSLIISMFNNKQSSSIENADKFQLQDTASINKIEFHSDQLNNTLLKTDTGWVINDKYEADENILRVLLSIMKQVKISRGIASAQKEEIINQLKESGIKVKFYEDDKTVESFTAGGNDTKTQSYFMDNNGKVHIVNLEGYDSYVSGIFEIPENDWRKRLLFKTSLSSIISVSLSYKDTSKQGFKLISSGNFFEMASAKAIDTTKAMNYAEQFAHFQTDSYYVKGTNKSYDSLLNTKPFCTLTLKDIHYPDGKILQFYPKLKNDNTILATFDRDNILIFKYRRIAGIFRNKEWFKPGKKQPRLGGRR